MRHLFSVPWLSSAGRIVLDVVCIAILVCGCLAVLRFGSGGKQTSPAQEFTGSIQRSRSVQKIEGQDPMVALLAAPTASQSVQKKKKIGTADPIPLPRP